MKKHTETEVLLSNRVKAFIIKDGIFSIRALETRLLIPYNTLHNAIRDGKTIPPKHCINLSNFLTEYGFKKD